MKVLHCSWIPEPDQSFIQGGDLWLWVEADTVRETRDADRHPRHLAKNDLIAFLEDTLGLTISAYERRFHIAPQRVTLPTVANAPLPAPEFEHGVDDAIPAAALRGWATARPCRPTSPSRATSAGRRKTRRARPSSPM